RFRFAFNGQSARPARGRSDVEAKAHALLLEDRPVHAEIMTQQQARDSGAMALFGEKYGDAVRVVSVGDWARELCGGTHAQRSGEIGLALISNDRSIGAGIRRIEMRAGEAAEQQVRDNERVLRELGDALRTSPSEFPSRVAAFQAEIKRLEREATSLRQKLAAGGGAQLEEADVEGVRL